MKTNNKKAFPVSGLEQDATYARGIYCFINNIRGIKRYVKQVLNRRMRRYNKNVSNFTPE